MAGHAARDRVDAEADTDALLTQKFRDLEHGVLGLCDRHAVARHDDHLLGTAQQFRGLDGAHREGFALRLAAGTRGGRDRGAAAEAAGDHADEVAVHRAAHDVGKDRAG